MKKIFVLGAASALLGLGLVGCSNTTEGAKEDVSNAGQAASKATENAANATKNAADRAANATKNATASAGMAISKGAKNVTAATEVTPDVKTAITADKQLNDTRNLINVESKNGTVHLKGHVISDSLKKHASQVATAKLAAMHATDKVSNELTVSK